MRRHPRQDTPLPPTVQPAPPVTPLAAGRPDGPPRPASLRAREQDLPRWVHRLVYLLDDLIRVPGTRFGIGLDAIIGLLLPGVGDGLTAVGSATLLLTALRRRLPTVTIARMALNILIDALGGSLPLVGDAFDLFFKSNRRNLALLQRQAGEQKARATAGDYLIVGVGLLLALAAVALPLVLLYFGVRAVETWLGG